MTSLHTTRNKDHQNQPIGDKASEFHLTFETDSHSNNVGLESEVIDSHSSDVDPESGVMYCANTVELKNCGTKEVPLIGYFDQGSNGALKCLDQLTSSLEDGRVVTKPTVSIG